MGIQDREWWIEAQKKRARENGDQSHWATSSGGSRARSSGPISKAPARKAGPVLILFFWLSVLAVVCVAMDHFLKPKPIKIDFRGDLRIPRARDGHFHAPGAINGKPIMFLVDTGASSVTVSEEFAKAAGLSGGEPTTFSTANGLLQGRTLRNIPVSLGNISVSGLSVGVGLVGHKVNEGLLGQNFLSKFQVVLNKDEMVIRAP